MKVHLPAPAERAKEPRPARPHADPLSPRDNTGCSTAQDWHRAERYSQGEEILPVVPPKGRNHWKLSFSAHLIFREEKAGIMGQGCVAFSKGDL